MTGTLWFLTLGLLGIGWLIDVFFIPWMERTAEARYTPGATDWACCWSACCTTSGRSTPG